VYFVTSSYLRVDGWWYDLKMPPQTPYTLDLADREPLSAMRDTATRIATLTAGWTPAEFERTYAPGKWTARQILTHLAQTELALGNRARMALATPNYTAQPFDQDRWMLRESTLGGREAVDALVAANVMNRALFAALSPRDRAMPFSHPEYGSLTVDWIIHQMAGHLLHHLVQLETIAKE
jgi:DinB superfamily